MNIGTLPLPRWPLTAGDIDRGSSDLGLDEGLNEGLSVFLEGLGRRRGDSVEGNLGGKLVGKKVWLCKFGAIPWVHGRGVTAVGTGAKVEKKLWLISGLGLNLGKLFFAGSLLNVLTLTPNPGNTIRAWRLASNCNGGFQPATGRMEKGEQEFLGARLLCQSLVARLVALVT